MKIRHLFFLVPASLLVGCLQEDPQLQSLRDERDAGLARIQKLEEEVQAAKSAAPPVGAANASPEKVALEKEVATLKEQLAIAQAEARKAKEVTPEVLSEEELLVSLRVATEAHRAAIRERFDVVNIVLSEFTMPQKEIRPYRCGVQYDLVEKSTGEPYHLDVNVSAPITGAWDVPPISEFANKIIKGPRAAVASANPQPNIGAQPVNPGGTVPAPPIGGGQTVSGLPAAGGVVGGVPVVNGPGQQPSGPGQPVNNGLGQPVSGGGQLVTGLPGGGGPGLSTGQNLAQPQNEPTPAAPEPSGPGMGNISKKLKVNWDN